MTRTSNLPSTNSTTFCFISYVPINQTKKQVESVGSPEDAQRAYVGFLRQFPLCFGYWKKVGVFVVGNGGTAVCYQVPGMC